MKKNHIVFLVIIVSISGLLSGKEVFDPKTDGWYFENWGEKGDYCINSCDFSWDLFRETYLGIYPEKDCDAAPWDCAFYDIFKNCAKEGNCGGMSVLALALYKYGGYMGFCSPASFYTGTEGPDREDLHLAINVLQARQFSFSGITRFIEAWHRGTLKNAEAAFNNVREQLGKGDYPVIWIATDTIGGEAHTVIPYKYKVSPGGREKIMYIWDSNNPYDDYPDRYENENDNDNRLIIKGSSEWVYSSGDPHDGPTIYSGGGWCLCVPMSDILKKSRHPFAVEIAAGILHTLFVDGPGAAVSQITDDEGGRFYKNDNAVHTAYSEIETDPNRRLKGAVRWPWADELYFMLGSRGKTPNLKVTLSGKNYKAIFYSYGNLIEIKSRSPRKTRDIIKFSEIASLEQSIEIKTSGYRKEFDIKQLRTDISGKNYRSFHVKNLIPIVPVTIDIIGGFKAVEVSAKEKKINFEVDIMQKREEKISSRQIRKLSTVPGKVLKIGPKNWEKLKTTELYKKIRLRLKKKQKQVTQ